LLDLIREAAIAPVYRRPTKPTKASKTRRLVAKSHRSDTKRLRGKALTD
jgi:ribosome-associated protein